MAVLALFSVWVSWLFCPIMKSVSDSLNWLKSRLFCCFFFQVETILKSTNELTNLINQVSAKRTENNDEQNANNKCILRVLEATCCRSLPFCLNFSLLGQLSVACPSVIFGSASNWITSFRDVKNATITATASIKNIEGKIDGNCMTHWKFVVSSNKVQYTVKVKIEFSQKVMNFYWKSVKSTSKASFWAHKLVMGTQSVLQRVYWHPEAILELRSNLLCVTGVCTCG